MRARLARLFGGRVSSGPGGATAARIKEWVRSAAELPGDAAIAVNEIACMDPVCPGVETVVLVMAPGRKTRAYKVAKAMGEVTEQDIRDALV